MAANPKLVTSSPPTFASEHADFTAAQTANQISVDDCWFEKKNGKLKIPEVIKAISLYSFDLK